MVRIPYEIIEFREHAALKREFRWKHVLVYWLYLKSTVTLLGIGLSCMIYGYHPSWDRNMAFWRFEVVEALAWIPMVLFCGIAEYALIILRVHEKMGVVLKGRKYFRLG